MTAVAKARDWLTELRQARDARDKDAFIDLLTAIALAAPELQGAACEIARGFGDDDGDRWEEWARGFFILPTSQPSVAPSVVPKADDAAKLDAAIKARAVPGGLKRRKLPPDPSATPKVEEKARSIVGPPGIEAAPQVSGGAKSAETARAKVERALAPELIELSPPEAAPAEIVLDRGAPRDTAKRFAQACCVNAGALTTWHWDGRFWQWNGCFYEAIGDDQLIDKIWKFLDEAKVGAERNRFRPRPRDVDEVLKALRSAISIDLKLAPPAWLGADPPDIDPRTLLVFRNTLVNIETGEVLPLTPSLWTHDGAGYDYDPIGECPRWEQFLAEVFPDDPESQATLEEMLGYGMTYDTKFEKGFLLVGVKRSGKSTVAWILKKLVGDQAYIGLSFNTLTKGENSVAEIVDKKVAVFSDARFRQVRMFGASYDPGGIGHAAAELLLNIIGRDTISLGRKYKSKWIGQLPTKIVITSNEVPNLRDASGVLPTRFVKLEFKQSFYGHEDIGLRDKLSCELPGIANRCLAALRSLNERGRFIQPKSGKLLEQAIENLTNPYAAFMHEKWERDDASKGPTMDQLYGSFKRWCEDNGRVDLIRSVPQNKLISYITTMDEWSWLRTFRPHGEKRRYPGLKRKARDGD